ncbi:MAG: hypothetical protein ACTSWC_13925 [Promethearchaeota archaeon]
MITEHGVSALNVLAKNPTVWYFDSKEKVDENKLLNQFAAMNLDRLTFKSHSLEEVRRIFFNMLKSDKSSKTNIKVSGWKKRWKRIKEGNFLQLLDFGEEKPESAKKSGPSSTNDSLQEENKEGYDSPR